MSLDGAYDPDNIFAKIIKGDAPYVKVFEDDAHLAFLDIFPQTRGHTLVIPKTPARNLFEISPDDLAALAQRTQIIAKAVRTALSPQGVYIGQFNGAEAGQTVFHIHFHVIPRYANAPYSGHGQTSKADPEELAALADQIRAAL